MGKRSRKRLAGDSDGPAEGTAEGRTSRTERDAARERRAQALARGDKPDSTPKARSAREADRPPAPWGAFPLAEVVGLLSLILLVVGFFVQGPRGFVMILAALVLGSIVGLELSAREHFAGYRSHSTLLAGVAAVLVMAALVYSTGFGTLAPYLVVPVGALVFVPCFVLLRRTFRTRSGGLSFR